MYPTDYTNVVLAPSFIAENHPSEESELQSEPAGWTDDEIQAIRRVLSKLSAIRIFNSSDAEDLVQETLLTMITKFPETELEKGLLVWSLGILRKKVGNYYRKAQRYTTLIDEQNAGLQSSVCDLSPESTLFHEELQTIIQESLAQLPLSQRQALELMIAGFDAGEIARRLHPERYQNVINSLYRGRKKLARELARHGYHPKAAVSMRKLKMGRGKAGETLRNREKVVK